MNFIYSILEKTLIYFRYNKKFYLKLKKAVFVAHPDIFKAISILQDQEVEASLNYYKALNRERIPARIKKRNRKGWKNIDVQVHVFRRRNNITGLY